MVPGHGPVSDLDGVRAMRGYWEFVAAAVRDRVGAGMTPEAAASDIVRSPEFTAQPFSGWDALERIVVNAGAIVRSDRGETGRMSGRERMGLLAATGELARTLRR